MNKTQQSKTPIYLTVTICIRLTVPLALIFICIKNETYIIYLKREDTAGFTVD